jgi:hypothetical protein
MKYRLQYINIITFLLIIGCKEKDSNYFTGTIVYNYSYQSDKLNTDSLSTQRTRKGFFRYDLTAYQSLFAGKDTQVYYYDGLLNKCVSRQQGTSSYSCEDYSIQTDSVLSWKLYPAAEKILGYDCNVLEMQKGNSWVKYHVAKDLKIAAATYRSHQSYNWDMYGEKASGGLILRSEHRFRDFTMTGYAVEIKQEGNDFKALELSSDSIRIICALKN